MKSIIGERDVVEYVAFAAVGAIILIGFVGSLLFEKTKIPDLLILVFIGLFLGPVAASFNVVFVSEEVLHRITPYFASLALVIILFDSGLDLDFDRVLNKIGITVVHTIMVFTLSIVSIALVAYYILGYSILDGLLLGCILGGISGAIVIPLVSRLSVGEETKTILTLESVLTDVLCIIVAISLLEVLEGVSTSTGRIVGELLGAFVIAGFLGLLFGIFWLKVLTKLHGKPFAYMITIGALFLLYAGVESIYASGAIAALVFGLVLSNKEEFVRIFKIKTEFVLDGSIRQFHSELSFLVRTFFFVYLGMVFTLNFQELGDIKPHLALSSLVGGSSVYLFLLAIALIFVVIVVTRYVASIVTTTLHRESRGDRDVLWRMLPRGLAAAVLASLPLTLFPDNPVYRFQFPNIVFMILLSTVIATSIGVYFSERKRKREEEEYKTIKQKEKWYKELKKEKREFVKREKKRKKKLKREEREATQIEKRLKKRLERGDKYKEKMERQREKEKKLREKGKITGETKNQ